MKLNAGHVCVMGSYILENTDSELSADPGREAF